MTALAAVLAGAFGLGAGIAVQRTAARFAPASALVPAGGPDGGAVPEGSVSLRVPAALPVVATAALCALAGARFGLSWQLPAFLLLAVVGVLLAVIDLAAPAAAQPHRAALASASAPCYWRWRRPRRRLAGPAAARRRRGGPVRRLPRAGPDLAGAASAWATSSSPPCSGCTWAGWAGVRCAGGRRRRVRRPGGARRWCCWPAGASGCAANSRSARRCCRRRAGDRLERRAARRSGTVRCSAFTPQPGHAA